MPRAAPPDPSITTRVLRLRIKDKHAPWLREMALHVNQVWNYCNELGFKVWLRERRFMSGFDFAALCSPLQPIPAGQRRKACRSIPKPCRQWPKSLQPAAGSAVR